MLFILVALALCMNISTSVPARAQEDTTTVTVDLESPSSGHVIRVDACNNLTRADSMREIELTLKEEKETFLTGMRFIYENSSYDISNLIMSYEGMENMGTIPLVRTVEFDIEAEGNYEVWTYKDDESTFEWKNIIYRLILPEGAETIEVNPEPSSSGLENERMLILWNVDGPGSLSIDVEFKMPTARAAAFTSSGLNIDPSSVDLGGTLTISVEVTNTGAKSGTHTVALKIDGEVEDEKTVTVNPDETETVTFSLAGSQLGTFSVEMDGLSGSYTVTEPEEEPSFWERIPGFPYEAIVMGLIVGVLVLCFTQQRR